MKSLDARIKELESSNNEGAVSAIVLRFLTATGADAIPVNALYEAANGKRWERAADETEQAFIDRAAGEAKTRSRNIPLLFVQ